MFYSMMYPMIPMIPIMNEEPPQLYRLMQSIVNYGKTGEDITKITDLAKKARTTIFNFDYPLSSKVDKEKFEVMILNHFIDRQIGYQTFTAFQIHLNAKLNEIMPTYNLMFDSMIGWDLFVAGEKTTINSIDNRTTKGNSTTESSGTSTLNNESITEATQDLRYSKMPQNEIDDIKDGNYMTDYNYNQNKGKDTSLSSGTNENKNATNNSGTDENVHTETIERSPADKIRIMQDFQKNIKSIYTLIFNDLDNLFYQIIY